MRSMIRIMAIGTVLAVSVSPVSAQGVFDMGVLTNTVSIPRGASAPARTARSVYSPGERAISVLPNAFGRGAAPAGAARLSYSSTPALRRQALDGYLARASRQYPEAARVMSAQFAKHDYAAVYRSLIGGTGLRDNDAADAVTAYTVLGWQIANGYTDNLPPARIVAARRQIAAALAANPQLSSPATRPALGEEMKLLMVTLHAGWQSAQREGNLSRYADGVARLFRTQSGRDLRSLTLTDAGFSRKG